MNTYRKDLTESLTVRLSHQRKAKLRIIAFQKDLSMTQVIEQWIDRAKTN